MSVEVRDTWDVLQARRANLRAIRVFDGSEDDPDLDYLIELGEKEDF